MDIWQLIESLLSRFADDEADRRELRELTEKLPSSLQRLPPDRRTQAQALGAEALYRSGQAKRTVFWSQPVLGPATSLWVGRALFDLDRPAQALRQFRNALDNLVLLPSTRGELEALIDRCTAANEPDASLQPTDNSRR